MVKYQFKIKVSLHVIRHYNAPSILHYTVSGVYVMRENGPELLSCSSVSKVYLDDLEVRRVNGIRVVLAR